MLQSGAQGEKLKIHTLKSVHEHHLRVWHERANVTKSHDEESKCLNEEVKEIVIISEGNVITSTEEEVRASSKL